MAKRGSLPMRPVVFDVTMYANDVAYDYVASMSVGTFVIGEAPESFRVEDVTGDSGSDLAPKLAKGRLEVDLTDEESQQVRDLTALGWDKIEAIRKVLPIEDAFARALSGGGTLSLDFTGEEPPPIA